MSIVKLVETVPGKYSVLLNAGTTPVDAVIEERGHEPNGYFWEGLAQFLVSTTAQELEGRFSYDSSGGMFCAYGEDRPALEELMSLMETVAGDVIRVRDVIAMAEAGRFEFDD